VLTAVKQLKSRISDGVMRIARLCRRVDQVTNNEGHRCGPADLAQLNTISVVKRIGLTHARIRHLLVERSPSLEGILRFQADAGAPRTRAAEHADASGFLIAPAQIDASFQTFRQHKASPPQRQSTAGAERVESDRIRNYCFGLVA
jgi:hypothetical protein